MMKKVWVGMLACDVYSLSPLSPYSMDGIGNYTLHVATVRIYSICGSLKWVQF